MMTDYRWADLATYNAERARGIRHTKAWKRRMAEEQVAFDAAQRADLGRTMEEVAPGLWVPRDLSGDWIGRLAERIKARQR
jgi:hypothetical protein